MDTKITYSLTEEDALALNKFRYQTDPFIKERINRSRNRLAFGFAIVGIGFLVLSEEIILSVVLIIFAVIFFFFYHNFYQRSIKKRIRETYKRPEYISTISSISLEAFPDGLVQTANLGQTTFDWSQVDNFFETPDHVFVSIGKVLSVTLPKKSTQINDGVLDDFIMVCKSYINQAT